MHDSKDLGTPLWGVQDDSMEGGGRERLELVFQTESRTTLHAVITMDGVYAGFAGRI